MVNMLTTHRSILGEMNFDGVLQYNQPFIVSFSGLPGSGKTEMSRFLSRDLRIFLLSNDYVRNYYYTILKQYCKNARINYEMATKIMNEQRLLILLANHIPFVFDSGINDISHYRSFENISRIFKYELIKIRINSNDEDNITRISKRNFDLDEFDDTIIGDGYAYSFPYDSDEYYRIKKRKSENLNGVNFDYTIDNYGTKEEFDEQAKSISSDISRRMR